jgi:hypothetical protein
VLICEVERINTCMPSELNFEQGKKAQFIQNKQANNNNIMDNSNHNNNYKKKKKTSSKTTLRYATLR